MSRNIAILILILSSISGFSQKVTVSEEINLRSDFLYDLIGEIDGKVLLYRDKGFDHVLHVYDENLWEREVVELEFEKKRVDAVGLVPSDKYFSFFYSYRNKGSQILACRKFDGSGRLLDTATIAENNLILNYQKYFYNYSTDRKYAAIFSFPRDNVLNVHMINIEEMSQVWQGSFKFDFPYIKRDFRELVVTDQGGSFLIFEKDNFKIGAPEITLEAYYLNQVNGGITKQVISMADKYIVDFSVDYDNINNKLILVGLYGDKYRYRANGFFYLQNGVIQFTEFDQQLFRDLEKNSKKRISNLEDYVVADMVIREDGGALMLLEMQRQFSRRTNMVEGRRPFDSGAYMDYYHEDIIALSVHPDGQMHWRKILRKKQFSQDDGAAYSSFFVFKSPTELRIIYNDEIRQDNTVSEYIINPIGEDERNIVMNTEYQKLRLRFLNAKQISSKDFIVPSERNNRLNLVKVSF